jgi:hypothetical protein
MSIHIGATTADPDRAWVPCICMRSCRMPHAKPACRMQTKFLIKITQFCCILVYIMLQLHVETGSNRHGPNRLCSVGHAQCAPTRDVSDLPFLVRIEDTR